MSKTEYYLTPGGIWKTRAEITLEAIDVVCGECNYAPEDTGGTDPCEGCRVLGIARRMEAAKEAS